MSVGKKISLSAKLDQRRCLWKLPTFFKKLDQKLSVTLSVLLDCFAA